MKKAITAALGTDLVFSFSATDEAEAKTKAKTYKNWTELNKAYKDAAAKSS